MKERLKILVGTSFFAGLLLFTPAVVSAVDATDPNISTTSDTTAQITEEKKELTDEQKAALKAKMQERVEKRKAELEANVSVAAQARIKTRCVAAQGKISSTINRVKGLETSRTQVYKNTVDKLTSLSEKLKAKSVDTTKLDAEITQLNTLIETFNTDLGTYKETVSDLAEMDCATDPTAFKATLEAARTSRATAATSAQAVKTYMQDTLKPTLQAIRVELAGSSETETQNQTESKTETSPTDATEAGGTQ